MENKKTQLPENAQRELRPGEEYQPLLSPKKNYPEVTPWSVGIGLIMTVIFSAAAAYLGLKVGQVFEAAIPIAIIAVGLSSGLKRKDALGENVMIQSIGSCSGAIVAGAIFTLPALFILQDKYPELTVNFTKVFFSSLLGGILGILFLIPFRKYFVKEQHGKYPFPEATATTQVLVSGESGGKGASTLLVSGVIGGLYDFIVSTFGLWGETLTTKVLPWGAAIAEKAKVILKVNTGAAVLGLGYIVGLKYAFIICCGSFLVWLVIIPVMNLVWGGQVIDLMNSGITQTIGEMSADQIFKEYARHIGIGGIATAGIVGIVKSFGVIKSAVGLAANEFNKKKSGEEAEVIGLCLYMPLCHALSWGGDALYHAVHSDVEGCGQNDVASRQVQLIHRAIQCERGAQRLGGVAVCEILYLATQPLAQEAHVGLSDAEVNITIDTHVGETIA